MKPQTSAEMKYLSRRVFSEASTRIRLLWARLITSFFERCFVDIVIRLPEWQPATRMSFLALVATMQVIVSVLIDNSTFNSCAFQNFSVQSSETVTSSRSLSLIIWLMPELCSSMLLTGWNLIRSLACWILNLSLSSIWLYALRRKLTDLRLNCGTVL